MCLQYCERAVRCRHFLSDRDEKMWRSDQKALETLAGNGFVDLEVLVSAPQAST
jgi:hypothetical protein